MIVIQASVRGYKFSPTFPISPSPIYSLIIGKWYFSPFGGELPMSYEFPPGFEWGVATVAYQIEGAIPVLKAAKEFLLT
jgi:hypothetical protein